MTNPEIASAPILRRSCFELLHSFVILVSSFVIRPNEGFIVDAVASDKILVTVDGRTANVAIGTTILNAARQMGITIPTLCSYRGLSPYGACRVCLVEIETPRGRQLAASCSHPVSDKLVVHTDTENVRETRRTVLELLLAQAPESQELAEFAARFSVQSTPFEPAAEGKCILCGLCARVCNEMMGRGAINLAGRSTSREVRTAYGERTDQCQACGACVLVCPTGAVDLNTITARRTRPHNTKYDQFLSARPCIDLAHPQASPRVPSIDRENCVHFLTGECGLCANVCQAGAIDYDQAEESVRLDVGAVVLTPGFEAFDATRRGEFGFGFAPNVLTNVQFERLLSAAGPTTGHVLRPSDGKPPKRLAFIQCIGSRDSGCDNDYCSSVCCMAATKEAILAKEHVPGLDVTVFFLDLRAFGKDFDRYCERAQKQLGVRYIRSFISRTYEMPGSRNLRLVHVGPEMKQIEDEFDMVVLSLGLEPSATLQEQAERMQVVLNRWGFAQTTELCPLDTSRPGVFVGGAFQEPKDIPDTVMQASAAAARAMSLLAPARGTRVRTKTYPPQRDVTDEPPRIGIFVCHCGSNIASVVDVEAVVKQARDFPHVVVAEHNVYTCADNSQDRIKEKIKEHRLNRVVIASCTPRTHEPIFRDTLRDVGLNPYLIEMANIRDQCSWVHSATPDQATAKAMDLVRMAAGRAANLRPLVEETVPITNAALVVGGGIAGMTAALALADQGFPVHLVEKTDQLGGTIREIHRTLDREDVQAFLAQTMNRVRTSKLITVHLRSHVSKVEGHVGGFTSKVQGTVPISPEEEGIPDLCKARDQEKGGRKGGCPPSREIKHGVVIVATGATEQKPKTFGYGQSGQVLTQLELSDRLGKGQVTLPAKATVAMIQCVEQRNEEHPYCSRVCCTTAVKNALLLREQLPDARIMVLYRDMRTYGFREAAYREAREKGILFVRYEPDRPPQLDVNGGLRLKVREPALGRDLEIRPDLVVLAAPMVPRADRQELSDLLRVPLNADGFFLEAHMKLRPVDFASEGLFLCGTAHAPKFISEAISQANAVAARAASILSRKQMPVSGQIAYVDPDKCISCMTCVHVCPYMAPHVGENNKAEVQAVVCMGCGSCTAECPAKAISLRHYVDAQVLGAIEALLTGAHEDKPVEMAYPEPVGVAQPRWHKG
jgi:heterodisulfide reductase subunit A2